MNIDSFHGKVNVGSPWLKKLNANVLGNLRGIMTQQTDGSTTILRPRPTPWVQRTDQGPLIIQSQATTTTSTTTSSTTTTSTTTTSTTTTTPTPTTTTTTTTSTSTTTHPPPTTTTTTTPHP